MLVCIFERKIVVLWWETLCVVDFVTTLWEYAIKNNQKENTLIQFKELAAEPVEGDPVEAGWRGFTLSWLGVMAKAGREQLVRHSSQFQCTAGG